MDNWEKLQAIEQNFFAVEQQLQAIARALPHPIFVIDEFGKYLNVIGGKERSPFHSGKFLKGKFLHDVLPEDLADMFIQAISAAIADNALQTIEYQLGPDDITGSTLDDSSKNEWFQGRVYPLKDKADEIHSVIFLAIKITDRKNLEEQLDELSERDALTGAYNRRHFMQIYDKAFSIAKRYKTKLSVLHIDIDNFKAINEKYGYDAGDAVLKQFVMFCENNLRQSDLFARYDGVEFIVLMQNTPSLGATIFAERIRANIEELSVTYGKQTIQFTISIGISLALDTDSTSTAVLNRADTALYLAKKKGRNRIEIS
jgi:diguanylate cyclase (GGDEF)-like protein